MANLDGLSELEDLNGFIEDFNSEVLCFILKDESKDSIIGGRYKSYIEAKAIMQKFPDRRCLAIYKVIKDGKKRIFKKVQ